MRCGIRQHSEIPTSSNFIGECTITCATKDLPRLQSFQFAGPSRDLRMGPSRKQRFDRRSPSLAPDNGVNTNQSLKERLKQTELQRVRSVALRSGGVFVH